MTNGKDPARQLIDVMFYAPIGLLALAQRELPRCVATAQTRLDNQISLARIVGKVAVKKGRRELGRRLHHGTTSEQGDIEATPTASISIPTSTSTLVSTSTSPSLPLSLPTREATPSLPAVLIAAVAQSPLLREPIAELPIEGYDSLAASQVVLRLGSLTRDELVAVQTYEHGHRARRTILGKINQLQAI